MLIGVTVAEDDATDEAEEPTVLDAWRGMLLTDVGCMPAARNDDGRAGWLGTGASMECAGIRGGDEIDDWAECWVGPGVADGDVMWNCDMVGVASLSLLTLPLGVDEPASVELDEDAVLALLMLLADWATCVEPEKVADTSMDGGGACLRKARGWFWSISKRTPPLWPLVLVLLANDDEPDADPDDPDPDAPDAAFAAAEDDDEDLPADLRWWRPECSCAWRCCCLASSAFSRHFSMTLM